MRRQKKQRGGREGILIIIRIRKPRIKIGISSGSRKIMMKKKICNNEEDEDNNNKKNDNKK